MWDFFIKNNKFGYLFLVALMAVGSYSLIAIPKESSPEVIVPVGVVSTVMLGAPAADVESLITNEIERGLSSLENVKKITSTSREGVSSVVVEFEAEADLDDSIQDLKDEVDTLQSELPADAEDSFVSEVNFVDQPILTVAVSGELSDFQLTDLSKKIEKDIESIAGVSRVEARGVRDREVTVIVNQESLVRYNLNITDVTSAIRNANLTLPIGQIENNGVAYNIAFEGDISTSEEISLIPVANLAGQPVYVSDIATVEDYLSPGTSLSRLSLDGEPSNNSVTFNIFKQSGGDITEITEAVNSRFSELKAKGQILAGLTTVVVLDAGADIKKDLVRLSASGLQTVTLVMILLVVAIGWREGLLSGLAIPLSFLFGFIGLYLSGNTINFLSLFSLILGIGILVDSAIVMIEGISRKMKDHPTIDKREAAISTIKDFSAPLISGTLTTVSMFVGLFIVSGVIGQFISSIPFTLIFLLFASMFVALAILPLIAATFLHRRNQSKFEVKQVEYAHRLEELYKNLLQTFLESKEKQNTFLSSIFALLIFAIFLPVNVFAGLVAGPAVYLLTKKSYDLQIKKSYSEFKRIILLLPLMVVTVVASSMLASTILPKMNLVEVIFFDQSDIDYLVLEVENPEGTTKEITDIDVRRVEELLYDESDIESFSVTVGSGSEFASAGTGEKFANIFINLDVDRQRTSTELVSDLRSKLAVLEDVNVTIDQLNDGPPTGAAIIVKFLGDDLEELTTLINKSAAIFRVDDRVINVQTSINNNSTEFVLELDKDKAASLGLSPFYVSQVARTALYGSEATSLTTLDDDIDVVVKLNINNSEKVVGDTTNVTDIDALNNISIQSQSGPIPLSSIVNVHLRESSSLISHEEGQRVVSITADVADGANAREVQSELLNVVTETIDIPEEVTVSTGGGETDESNKAFIEMALALLVGIGLMVGILTLQFNSYLHMKYVLSILPYSLIGIMFGLAITQNTLSFPSMMGFIALSGIVVNNSILLIDMMNQLRRSNPEKEIKAVVLQAAGNRLRPILLTTITTVIGMIPLTYAGDLWSPLAYAVMFGLVFSVIITLVLIPITYYKNPGKVESF